MQNVQILKATKQTISRRNGIHVTTLRVAAYCRVSTDDAEQLESYQSQVKYYTNMINENPEWQMAGVYADEAITGTSAKKREDFQRMINDCMNGNIDMILVKSISRFARNTLDTLRYVRQLKEIQVSVLFEEENINTLTMDGELLLTILSSVAQQEVQNISEHVKLGLSMKMKRGELVGFNGCLGYDYDPELKNIFVNSKEAEVVQYIFQRYAEGAGGQVIAKELINLGYKNKRNTVEWRSSTILGIIKNEKYVGDLLMGKTFTVDPISKRRLDNQGEADQYYIENHHEAIIDRQLFEQAQAILKKRSYSHSRGSQQDMKRVKFSRQYAFSSLLKCGFCGASLTRRSWNNQSPNRVMIWHCVSSTKYGKSTCPHSKGIRESIIEKAFVQAYNLLCHKDSVIVDNFLEHVKKALYEDNSNQNKRDLELIEIEIQKVQDLKCKVVEMLLNNNIDKDTYTIQSAKYMSELTNLTTKRDELKENQKGSANKIEKLQKFKAFLNSNETLVEFDRHVFECVVDNVIVGKEKESGEIDPYSLTFNFKSGVDNSIVVTQPLSGNNACSDANNATKEMCSFMNNDTRGDGFVDVSEKSCEILEFMYFEPHTIFERNSANEVSKRIKKGISVYVHF